MSITVKANFNSGGSNATPGNSAGNPSIATVLRGLITDIGAVRVATVTSTNASDLATAITLVNEIKTKINSAAAVSATVVSG